MYEGIGNLTCPCCTGRNRQNVRTLLGLPSDDNVIRKHAKPSVFRTDDAKRQEQETKIDDASWNKPKDVEPPQPWMAHQPLPAVTNYLNPEFNRPIYAYQKTENLEAPNYVFDAVLNANTNYEDAMKKLSKFGSRQERHDDGSYYLNG